MLSREMVAMSSYFGMYNYMRDNNYHVLLSGGMAGLANWTLTYPIEVVKNRQLAQNISIRQALVDDPELSPEPKLVLIAEKKIPGELIPEFLRIKGVEKVSVY